MRGNVAGVNGGDDLQQWFRDIPFVSETNLVELFLKIIIPLMYTT